MSGQPTGSLPWSISDVRTAVVPIVLAVVLLVWGWWDASGTGDLDEQVSALVFAVLAAGAAVGGSLAWLAAGRRAVRARRLAVISLLEAGGFLHDSGARHESVTGGVVVVPGTSRFHRADCLLVGNKAVHRVVAGTDAVAGMAPCEMCQP